MIIIIIIIVVAAVASIIIINARYSSINARKIKTDFYIKFKFNLFIYLFDSLHLFSVNNEGRLKYIPHQHDYYGIKHYESSDGNFIIRFLKY